MPSGPDHGMGAGTHISIHVDHNSAGPGATQVNNVTNNFGSVFSLEQIDRDCLKALQCPDPFRVKNQLKATKDVLLRESFEWILHDPHYLRWRDGQDVALLWIRGGAGKGKTMMSIGLVEELSRPQQPKSTSVVTYFFCQFADASLNTIDALLKGLIHQLVRERPHAIQELRDRWDHNKNQFTAPITSDLLWDVFLAMLDRCKHDQIFLVVDALDECQEDMVQLLRWIVTTGVHQPTHVKWLLTSRPLDVAEQILLARPNQTLISLDVNLDSLDRSVTAYVSFKVAELTKVWRGCPQHLQRRIEDELVIKAEGTFLWVSLVCKELQQVDVQDALQTIEKAPAGLQAVYERAYTDICRGHAADVAGCTQMLRVMMLAFQPLDLSVACHLMLLATDDPSLELWVARCASFVKVQQGEIPHLVFAHQSARDYLNGLGGSVPGRAQISIDHTDMALRCLTYLTDHLTANFLNWPHYSATKGQLLQMKAKLPHGLAYPAEYWFKHIDKAGHTSNRALLSDNGPVEMFLRQRFLQWLEFLLLTDREILAEEALELLLSAQASITHSHVPSSYTAIVQDAREFAKTHREAISWYPLQLYSSVLIFSPEFSKIRQLNLDQIPKWLRRAPVMKETWPNVLLKTNKIRALSSVKFSPRGQLVASLNGDSTVKLWDTQTGILLRTIPGDSTSAEAMVMSVAFSSDEQLIASGGDDHIVNVWKTQTGELHHALRGHSAPVRAVAFSPDGRLLASGSDDKTVKLWEVPTGKLRYTLQGYSDQILSVTFSFDGQLVASGDLAGKIELWQTQTSRLHQTIHGYRPVKCMAFSPDGQLIAASLGLWVHLYEVLEPASIRTIFSGVTRRVPESREIWRIWSDEHFSQIGFSSDSKQLITGVRCYHIPGVRTSQNSAANGDESEINPLWVGDGWISCSSLHLLLLPWRLHHGYEYSFASHNDKIALGTPDGQLWIFDIDRKLALSATRP